MNHLQALTANLDNRDGFSVVMETVRTLPAKAALTLAKEFSGRRARSKAEALYLIEDRHNALMHHTARVIANGGRISG